MIEIINFREETCGMVKSVLFVKFMCAMEKQGEGILELFFLSNLAIVFTACLLTLEHSKKKFSMNYRTSGKSKT